jgi:glycine betaine/proline transport system substrate-binding protein
VPFGVDFAGSENWDGCIVKAEQDCADPKPTSWTKSEVQTVVTNDFKMRGGEASSYLEARVFPGPIMNGMLVYMQDNQATGADAAMEFLRAHEDVWTQWVSADVAAKVKAGM